MAYRLCPSNSYDIFISFRGGIDKVEKSGVGFLIENIRSIACVLLDEIHDFDFEKLQMEILHLYKLLFIVMEQQLETNNRDVLLLVNKTRDIILDLEDAIDEYVLGSGGFGEGNYFRTALFCFSELKARLNLRQTIIILADQLKSIAKNLELCNTKKVVHHRIKDVLPDQSSNQDIFVGRLQDLEILKSSLLENTDVSIIGIVGMGGIGKTTLANKLYSQVNNKFDRSAWINLSNKLDFKSFLQELTLQLTMETQEKVMSLSELDLLLQLHNIQLKKRYLIVIDDVWSTEAWLNLGLAFPSKQSGSSSKLLITTRIREVGQMVAANSGLIHLIKGFSEDESWDLISTQATGIKLDASKELIAKDIARKCNGLPLTISLLGKQLCTKHSLAEWAQLNQNIVMDKDNGEQEIDVIHQLFVPSFMDLSPNLKNCFLYMAGVSGKSEIDTKKLCMLWIAEGYVQSGYDASTETMIEMADRYLQELASRGMVQVEEDEISRVRKFRSCRLHSMIRDMCLLRAKEENFITVMDLRRSKQSASAPHKYFSTEKRVRKIAAHLDGNKKGCNISFGLQKTDKVRSLLVIKAHPSSHHKTLQEETPPMLMFKLLKVLHLDGLDLGAGNFSKQIEKLVFLRYLSLNNCYLEELPSSVSNLLNLETLDLRVRKTCLMTIYNVLRKMKHLKHLYLPQLFRVHNDEKLRLDSLTELETLENFNSKLCFAEDLLQLINLRFLTASIHEKLEDLETTIKCIKKTSNFLCEASLDVRSFHCCPKRKQSAVQKLFECNALNSLHLEGYLGKMPMIATSNLSEMLFSRSEFDQDPMPMLGKLPNLRVLVLYNHAFLGKKLLCPTLSFYELRHLKLSTLPDLENLEVEEGTMPKLSGLTIEECENLKVHPNQLKFLKNLKETKIRGIAEAFEQVQDVAAI